MKNLSLVFRSLALPVLLLTLNAAGAQEKQPLRYVDAATLTVIGKSMPTPKLFQRVDTARYELWQPVKNYSAFSTGLAVVFRTDSRTIRARWKTGGYGLGHNMTAIARKGLDLYIERDGQWVYAGFGWPKGDNHDSALVEYMDEGEKTCLVYLPLWDEVLSLELGIDGDSRIEAVPNPFRHRIVVLGSSITHGASAGRPGMTWTARLARRMGLDFLNLGYSGQCKLQPEFARMLAEMEADAFVFDAFSNPSAGEIEERLLRGARPQGASLDAADLHPDRGPRDREFQPPGAEIRIRQARRRRSGHPAADEGRPEHLLHRLPGDDRHGPPRDGRRFAPLRPGFHVHDPPSRTAAAQDFPEIRNPLIRRPAGPQLSGCGFFVFWGRRLQI